MRLSIYTLTPGMLLILLQMLPPAVSGQKPPLDTGTFTNWSHVGAEGNISDDGNYVCYDGYESGTKTHFLEIQACHTNWHARFTNASTPVFLPDKKHIIFMIRPDTVCLLRLGTGKTDFFDGVSGFSLGYDSNAVWLVCRFTTEKERVLIRDLTSQKEIQLSGVGGLQIVDNGHSILFDSTGTSEDKVHSYLVLLHLADRSSKIIWSAEGKIMVYPAADITGRNIVFLTKKDSLPGGLWYWRNDGSPAKLLLNDTSRQLSEGGYRLVASRPELAQNGRYVFFQVTRERGAAPGSGSFTPRVEIWSYLNVRLPGSDEGADLPLNQSAALDLTSDRLLLLTEENERIEARKDKWVLICKDYGLQGWVEAKWNLAVRASFFLVNLENGTRTVIEEGIDNPNGQPAISASGKWILYYDFGTKAYFTYNTATGARTNITRNCPAKWTAPANGYAEPSIRTPPAAANWLANDSAVLICDNEDVWELSPRGIHAPYNLTNGYGAKNHIQFSLLPYGSSTPDTGPEPNLYLQAIDETDERRGFFLKHLRSKGDPQLLSMGPYVYGAWGGHSQDNSPPVKAKDANCFLVKRMSATDAPNFFVTTDFREFTRLSDVQPQKAYNWVTSSLVRWKTFDGSFSTGILYKPEDFDPRKRYPVIFDYYEIRSDEVNNFPSQEAATGRINIAWFVSHGYLIFVPDIHYKIGAPGPSVYNSVVSAAAFLSKKPWVDGRRMGLQGHSFGGYETFYIVTHTSIFAAACAASGVSDLVSLYGSTARGGYPKYWAELGQGRLGAAPWDKPQVYLRNSPLFRANDITTPLLIMHNRGDDVVPFSQSVEVFTALRRLGRRAWLLQYDDSDHGLTSRASAKDYTMRLTQFFDHYLRDSKAPKWMTRADSGKSLAGDRGLEPDSVTRTPPAGLDKYIPDADEP